MLAAALSAAALALHLPSSPKADALCRRGLLQHAAAAVSLPLAARADVRGANEGLPRNEKDINKYLSSQGFPAMKVPSGLSPLVGYVGTANPANIDGSKVRARAFTSPLLIRFSYPSGWLADLPSITENGEAGNLGANNYIKGDSVNFAAIPASKDLKVADITKPMIQSLIIAQMSNDVYEDVKIKKLQTAPQPDGFELVVADFTYTLNTRAGFTVNRKGVVSATVAANALVGLVGATTALRYKELEAPLRSAVETFRCYPVKSPGFNLVT
ncbi:hypothetical protein AB1Y20_006732 [Prymnesium parvum]|uniref:PsbP C-terminal domain-containing protein n=1 Tax=Prymnesium parvum TaxID=97485 RepID=A0AB34IZ79_PRYPA